MDIPTALGLANASPKPRETGSARTLNSAERVAYQRAIEEVYWRHRIWPKDNPGPKPALDAVISREQIEKKVTDYLGKSQLLADERGRPITPSELQAEMDRMASHTKQPEVLHELFEALGNDPFVIAECLARPVVAERLLAGPTVVAGASPAPIGLSAAGTATSTETTTAYKLPHIWVPLDCIDDTWTVTTTVNAPDVRAFHTAIWTGSEMIVWGGFNNLPPYVLNTGGRYSPATDSWLGTSTINAPIARDFHTAVWTGTEMIVWGGGDNADFLNTGGRYNPTADAWTPTNTTNAPMGRVRHTAVWTGTETVVWGGYDYAHGNFNTGGRYTPDTDSWTATSTGTNVPEARWGHNAEWTGSEMIVWGGTNDMIYLNTGGRYNPKTDSWTATGVPNDVLGRYTHTAIWTGSEMIVWGGVDSTFNDSNTGGRYNPSMDSWIATSLTNVPSPRASHTAVWTDSEMIIWGGAEYPPGVDLNTGGRYQPITDSWTPTTTANAPEARDSHTAVWTGSEMMVWGGVDGNTGFYLNTGGRYCAPTPTPTPTPSATATPTATPAPSPTPRVTPTPRIAPTPRARPTPQPRP
jgi:N-acetylneuraminic acid mutarotase